MFRALLLFIIPISFLLFSCKKDPVNPDVDNGVYANVSVWKNNAIGAIYNEVTNSVAYNKPDGNGNYKIYISNFDGTGENQLTNSQWADDRHQWAEEWGPNGQFLICYIEKTDYVTESGHTRVPEDAIPGYGAYTDIWLVTRDGSQAWPLWIVPNDYDHGIIHGAISIDGTKFTWTERIQAPVFLDPNLTAGAYVFKVADLTIGATPSLSNVQTFQPGGVLAGGEVECISPDNTNILVYSTFESGNIVATPVYKIDIATGTTTKLTTDSFAQAPTYNPSGNKIVYMTGSQCDIFPGQLQGADWWIMNSDGTGKKRLTYMNKKDHPQSVNSYRLAGSLSFVNDSTFLGGIMTHSLGLVGYTGLVTF